MSFIPEVENITITRTLAEQMITDASYTGQRPLRERHYKHLAAEMLAGRFTTAEIKIAKVIGQRGRTVLINGQHTLWAVVESGKPIRLPVMTYHVEDAELPKLYSSLDIGLKRNTTDWFHAHGVSEKLGIDNARQINALASALRFIEAGFLVPHAEISQELLVESILEWGPTMKFYSEVCAGSDLTKALYRRDILSVALVTCQHAPTQAAEFWGGVSLDDGVRLNDPRKTLRKWIAATYQRDSKGMKGMLSEHGARCVATAWNSGYDHTDLKLIRVIDARRPMVLKGTPYKG